MIDLPKNAYDTAIRERDRRPPRAGWAPGLYGCTCAKCGAEFTGAKGAATCAPCAYAEPEPPRVRLRAADPIPAASLAQGLVRLFLWLFWAGALLAFLVWLIDF